jgi:formyl-CoA transferase
MFEQHLFADGTPVKLPALTRKLSATPGGTRWLGPTLGEHTDEVLQALGYTSDEVATFRRDGVI